MQDISPRPQTSTGTAVSAASDNKFAVLTEKLNKSYGSSRGIIDLDLQVNQGEVFGFLGPNGAGKTTTIRLLLNLIKPTAGKASLLGMDSERDSVEIRRHIGYLPGEFSLYPNLTGAQTLEYFANLRGVDGQDNWKYVQELAERLELDMSKKFRQYSRGNKQKVGIIQALMHHPRLLILDEPTSGLDPLNQQEFYKLIKEAQSHGSTVFFSSHIMSEVEKICDRVGIIREGKLVKVGGIGDLTDLKSHHLELTFSEPVPLEEFEKLPGVDHIEKVKVNSHETLRCIVKADKIDQVVKVAARYPLVNFVSREPSLEETFLDYYRDQTPLN
ncbi:MAG TPA: ABC transporter ATP-binding protein [Chloroflexia bacterium]|nr:ABC transporter ATP-binding protein [Chloroflexia bacterium]